MSKPDVEKILMSIFDKCQNKACAKPGSAECKACLAQISSMNCDEIKNFVSQMKKGGMNVENVTQAWNKLMSDMQDWVFEDMGHAVGGFNKNLQCFARELSSKATVPGDSFDKGIRAGQGTVCKKFAGLVVVVGVLLNILINVACHFLLQKTHPKMTGVLSLATTIVIAILMVVLIMTKK